jgi:poly [ADP-ribose] polymerase
VSDGKECSPFQTFEVSEVSLYNIGTLLLINRIDKQASQLANCHIVPLSWLVESDEAKKPLPESKYSFGQPNQASQAADDPQEKTADGSAALPADNKRTTRKRGAAASAKNDDAQKTSDTLKNGVDGKAEPSEDKKPAMKKRGADEEPVQNSSNKKAKDIQKTTTKAINVPIDEGFEELGKLKGKSAIRVFMCER